MSKALHAKAAAGGDNEGDGKKKRKGKSALKGSRVAAMGGPLDDETIKATFSLLPTVLIRAALLVLVKMEGQLMTAGCMEEAFIVLKCLPPALEALASHATGHSNHGSTIQILPAPRSKSNAGHSLGLNNADSMEHTMHSSHAASSRSAEHQPTPITQFVRALEMLDALDDTYALAESLSRDRARMASYPALRPNTTPSSFIVPLSDVPRPLARSHAGPDAEELMVKERASSPNSIENIQDDVVSRLVASATSELGEPLAPAPPPSQAAMLSLTIPATPPPLCDYTLDEGRLLHPPTTASDGKFASGSPTSGLMSPPHASSVAEHVCDGKLVQVWMLPRHFRHSVSDLNCVCTCPRVMLGVLACVVQMNGPDMTIPTSQFEAAIRATHRLSIATVLT